MHNQQRTGISLLIYIYIYMLLVMEHPAVTLQGTDTVLSNFESRLCFIQSTFLPQQYNLNS